MNSDHPESDWQVDQRFRELIRAEFGDVAGTRDPGDADPPPLAPPPVRRFRPARKLPDPIEYFNLGQEIDWAEPDEDFERWRPTPPLTTGGLPLRGLFGIALLLVTVAIAVAVLVGLPTRWPVGIGALVCAGVGFGLLFSLLPRHREAGGDGTQL